MSEPTSKQYLKIKEKYPDYIESLDDVSMATRAVGPLPEKMIQLLQLAASASARAEGPVHSHTRRALEAGATHDEVYQSILVLTSTIGFPAVVAAISWADDILEDS